MESATRGRYEVINCSFGLDLGAEMLGCASWGGTVYAPEDCLYLADDLCQFTPVEATTWGKITGLFR